MIKSVFYYPGWPLDPLRRESEDIFDRTDEISRQVKQKLKGKSLEEIQKQHKQEINEPIDQIDPSDIDLQKLLYLYNDLKIPISKIARKMKCSTWCVMKLIQESRENDKNDK